jgi:hypothetical protein
MRALSAVVLVACANAQVIDGNDASNTKDVTPPQDVVTIPSDGGTDVVIDVFDAGCAQDAALGGIGIPAGSTASSTTSYSGNTADMAIDGNTGTYWNAGGFTGSITVMFASPQTIDGIQLWVSALPASSETYTVFGIKDVVAAQVAQSTQTAPQGGAALQTIAIPNAAYDGFRIDVDGGQSWVAINEIAVTTTYCP